MCYKGIMMEIFKSSPLGYPGSAPFPLHGSPLRRAACSMLTIASSEPSFHSLSAEPGGGCAYSFGSLE